MGLGGKYITSWDDMRMIFVDKYHDYCKFQDIKEDIFKFMKKEDVNMDGFVERFKYYL